MFSISVEADNLDLSNVHTEHYEYKQSNLFRIIKCNREDHDDMLKMKIAQNKQHCIYFFRSFHEIVDCGCPIVIYIYCTVHTRTHVIIPPEYNLSFWG